MLRKTIKLGTGGVEQGPASHLHRQCLRAGSRAGRETKQSITVNMKMGVRREAEGGLCTWIIHTILTYLEMLMAVRV